MLIYKFVIPALSACAIGTIGGVTPAAATDLTANLGVAVGGLEAGAGASVGVGGHDSGGDPSGVNVGVAASVGSSGGGASGGGATGGGANGGGGASGNGGQQPGDVDNASNRSPATGGNSGDAGDNASQLPPNSVVLVGLPVFSADKVFIGTVEDVQGGDLIIDLHKGGTLQLTGGIGSRSSQGIFLSATEASLSPYINRSFVKLAIK